MLEILAEMQLKLDTITENVEKYENEIVEKRRIANESVAMIEASYQDDIKSINSMITNLKIEHSNITYSISIAKSVAAHYEQKAADKLESDSEAAAELYEAATTGGATEEDWGSFFEKTCLDTPEGIELPGEPQAAEEGEPETAREESSAA